MHSRRRATRHSAEATARKWRNTSFQSLLSLLPCSYHSITHLPLLVHHTIHQQLQSGTSFRTQASEQCSSVYKKQPNWSIDVTIHTNHKELSAWWQLELFPFCTSTQKDQLHSSLSAAQYQQQEEEEEEEEETHECAERRVLVCPELTVYVGPPQQLEYPRTVETESEEWARYLAKEAFYTYEQENIQYYNEMEEQCAAPRTLTRWIGQPLQDGYLTRRVMAYKDQLPEYMYEAHDVYYSSVLKRKSISWRGIVPLLHVPFASLSPYYGMNMQRSSWCMFGEANQLLPDDIAPCQHASMSAHTNDQKLMSNNNIKSKENKHEWSNQEDDDPVEHLQHSLWLALTSSLYSAYDAVWVRGAILTNSESGDFVFILGPPQSGKTTLALHALSAAFSGNQSTNEHVTNNHSTKNDKTSKKCNLRLTASERFLLADGVRPLLTLSGKPHLYYDMINYQNESCYSNNNSKNHTTHVCQNNQALLLAVGIPGSIDVGLGSILGTLKTNIPLASHVPLSFLTASSDGSNKENNNTESIAASLLQNSEKVLWEMTKRHRVHVNEMYSKECQQPQSLAPVVLGKLKGVLYLDWDVSLQSSVHCAVQQIPLLYQGIEFLRKVYNSDEPNATESLLPWDNLLPPIQNSDTDSNVNDDDIMNNVDESSSSNNKSTNDITSWDVFAHLLAKSAQHTNTSSTQMCCITGSVDYDQAINVIFDMLKM